MVEAEHVTDGLTLVRESGSWEAVGISRAAVTHATDLGIDLVAKLEEETLNNREIALRLFAYGVVVGVAAKGST